MNDCVTSFKLENPHGGRIELHPPHRYTLLKLAVSYSIPPICLIGKKFFSMQGKLVNKKQTHFLKQNFSKAITPILTKVVCRCLISELILLFVDKIS